MIRCPNCSSVLPELESQGLKQCPQCQCELSPAGLPPLPGFDLETAAPAQRSPTIFGLTSVGDSLDGGSMEFGLDNLPGAPGAAPRSSTAPLPGLPSVSDKKPEPALPSLEPELPVATKQSGTGTHHVIDFSEDQGSGLPALDDLPGISMDLPALAEDHNTLPGLPMDLPSPGADLPSPSADLPSPSVDLPSPTVDLPNPAADLPSPSADLPAISGSLPAVSGALPTPSAPVPSGPAVMRSQTPPPPPGSARYQRPQASRAPAAAAGGTPSARSQGSPLRQPASSRDRLRQALARNAPSDDNFLPGIEELDLDLAPEPEPMTADPIEPAANAGAVLPEDLPETVAAVDLSELSMPGETMPMEVKPPAQAAHGASPAPRPIENKKTRWPIFAGASLLTLALAGGASWHFGLLADFGLGADPQAPATGGTSLDAPLATSTGGQATPSQKLLPRSQPFTAALFSDTPLNAKALANAEKDLLGEVEASLYFALQNPDASSYLHPQLMQSIGAISQWKDNPAPYVQRVFGLAHLYQGQLELAEKSLSKAATSQKGSSDPLVSLYLAQLAHAQGKEKKSVDLIRSLALRAPELKRAELLSQVWAQGLPPFANVALNVPAWEGLVAQAIAGDAPASHAFSLAYSLYEQGEWAKANTITQIYSAKAKKPEAKHRWQMLFAKILDAQGNSPASQAILAELTQADPQAKDAQSLVWTQLYAAGQYKELNASVEAWLQKHPQDLDARLRQAQSLGALGDGSSALLMLAQIDHHLVAGTKLGPVIDTSAPSGALKALRAKAQAADATALMSITPKLAKVPAGKRRLAADSARVRGEILARRLAVKAANAAFSIAQELEPSNVDTPILQSKMLVKAGQFPRAMAVLEGAHAQTASSTSAAVNRNRAKWLAHQATLARQTGKSKMARRRLAQAQAMDPKNPQIELERANLLLQHGQEKQAEVRFSGLAARVGDMPGLMHPLAQIYLRRGELDKLDAMISPRLGSDKASLDTLISGARLRIAQNQLMPALSLANRALKQAPNNWQAHLVKAQVLVARGDLPGALAELQQFKPKQPSPKYELWLGKIKDAQGDLEGAYGHYRLASSLDKSSPEPRVLQAKILARRGNARKAISMLKPILKRKRATADVFLAMGIAHRDLRKPKKAVAFFKRAQAKAPGSYVAFYEEGRIASNHNRHAQVIRSMDRALAASAPAMPPRMRLDALRRLGQAYLNVRDFNRAEEVLSRYLIEAPRDDPGRGAVMRMMESL